MTTIKDISSVTSSFISNELFIVSGLPSDFSDKNDMTLLLTNFQDGVSMPVQPQCQMQQNLQYSLVVDERYQLLDSEETKTLSMLSNNSDIDIFEPQKIPILPVQKLNSTEFRPVTHIEIIRPNPSNAKQCTSRRVTGANRVVPMITSMWQKSELTTVEPSLSLMYKTILDDPEEHECELCHDKFLNVIQVEYHMREMHHLHIVMSEQCFVCRKKYVSQQRLKHHIITVHGIQCPELMCKICFMELNTIMEQKAHERKHDKVYACQYCSTKFASEYFCQKHHDEHLVHIKPFQCRICGKRFENGISLSVHGIRHKNLKCSLCNAVFSKEKELLLHVNKYDNEHKNIFLEAIQAQDHEEVQLESMLNVYLKTNSNRLISIEDKAVNDCMEGLLTSVTQTLDTIIKPSNERKGVKCKLCGLKVQSSKELVDHRRTNHLRSCTCLICGKRSPSVSQTWRHMGTHIDKARSTNSSDLQCQICNKLFPTRGKKNFHLERVHKVETVLRLHSCSVCDRKFQHKASRDKHMILHSEEKTAFKCSMCEQVFLRPKFLIRHMAEHEGRNECNICNKTFTRRRQLKLHLSTHSSTGMKNKYKCPTCPTTCQGLAGLKEHLRVHTGERPFACKECDAKFKRVHALKKHMRNVHNEPGAISYPCSFCTMVFNNRGNMLRHVLRIHQGLRRFICGLCGSRYGQNQDLRHHLKMKHELDMPVISCSDKKSVNEIYVLPPIDQLPESHPHAEKINKLVAIEKEKIARFNQVQSSNGTEDESTKPLLPISTAPVSTSIPPVSTVFPPTPSPPPAPLLPPPPPSTLPPPLPLLPSSPPILLPNLTSPSPDISEIQISQKLVTLYRCGVCLIDFLERDLLELHIVETHKIKPALKCDTAVVKPAIPDAPIAKSQLPGTDHSTLNTLSPLTTVLNETTINAASKQISGKTAVTSDCKCSECGKTFGNAARLERHFKTHVGTRPFGCEQCGKHFTEKHNLKVHMRTHTGERPYTCTQCGKQMRYLKDLADHKRQHLGVKPFACSECGAKFLRQRELVRHKMTHSGVKKYQCPTCDKTFTRLDQLKMVHMRCHETSSEPAPFVCTVCNKRFRVKCKLQQHQILHSGVKNHKCVICNKAFALEIYLKSHLKTHQKQHSYVQCPKCPRRFATQQTLLVHDEKFHTRLQKHKEDKKKKIIDMPLLESEIDMTDMDVGLLEDDVLGDKCGAVIYLQMMPELDVPLNH